MSSKGKYRYILFREVPLPENREGKGVLTFVMLNPSTAKPLGTDRKTDNDKTINRCIDFAKDWGYGRLLVVNLFARIATKPEDLKTLDYKDAVGVGSDDVIRVAIAMADKVICAWGNDIAKLKSGKTRAEEVVRLIRELGKESYRIGDLTNRLNPRHPSRLEKNAKPQLWNPVS